MLKRTLCIALLFVVFKCGAQDISSIHFEIAKTWQETIDQASKSSKIIFLDAYTTWCVPCKEMEANIFTQNKVATFFNENFINYKVQIDQTPKDDAQVRKRYTDAKLIERSYRIESYPTYLFVNGDGIVVHFIIGGTTDADEFIKKAKIALDPTMQYSKLREQFSSGRRDTAFLKSLIDVAAMVNDPVNRPMYVQTFLKTQADLLTKRNIMFIAQSVRSSSDVGFKALILQSEQIIPVIGARWRNYIISSVAFDELILPLVRKNGAKDVSTSGMISYTGEIEKNVDWKAIKQMLQQKFGEDADRIFVDAATSYYKWNSDWTNLNLSLKTYLTNSQIIDVDFLCNWMQYYVSFCKNKEDLINARTWIDLAASQKGFTCAKPYGLYLYQISDFKKAIDVLLAYQATLKQPDKDVANVIEQIKGKI
jgi:thioredoxin-related protein